MQPQQLPQPERQPVAPAPVPAPEIGRPSRGRSALAYLALILFGLALGGYALRDKLLPKSDAATGGGGGAAAVRTAVVGVSSVEQTLRLTGVTTAKNFASLVVPQLRGARGGGVSVNVSRGGGGMAISITASGGGGGGGGGGGQGSGTTSSSSTGSTAGAASVGVTSGGGSSAGGSSAMGGSGSMASGSSGFRGSSSNRFSSRPQSSSSSSSSSSASAGSSGSSSSSSSGGSGGGGGGGGGMSGGASDFMQVLQKVVPAGQMVKKGQVIAEFDKQYQLTRLDDYRATVVQSQQNTKSLDATLEVSRKAHLQSIAQAEAAVEKAKLDIKTTPVRSTIQAEQLKLALEEAEANLRTLRAKTPFVEVGEKAQRRMSEIEEKTSEIELKRAEQNVDRMGVTAPMNGMMVMQNTMRGSDFGQVQQGDQLFPGQMFAQVVDASSMLVSTSVNQVDVELIRVGAKARLHFDAYPGLELPAKVISIGAITKTGGMRANFLKEIPVFLEIEKMDPRVIPDLSVSVDVVLAKTPEQVVAPLESIFRDKPEATPYVYVKNGERFERREVSISAKNNIAAAVAEGLKPGEVIALESPVKAPDEGGGKENTDVQRS